MFFPAVFLPAFQLGYYRGGFLPRKRFQRVQSFPETRQPRRNNGNAFRARHEAQQRFEGFIQNRAVVYALAQHDLKMHFYIRFIENTQDCAEVSRVRVSGHFTADFRWRPYTSAEVLANWRTLRDGVVIVD